MSAKSKIEWLDGGATWKSAARWPAALVARFWENVDRNGPTQPHMDTPCWLWTAGVFSSGYGQFRAGTVKVRAHRAAYELTVGPVPDGKILRHRCDVKRCCRPDHVIPGTDAENAGDRVERGTQVSRPPPGRPGESNPSARLTSEHVEAIRERRRAGWSYRRLAEAFGISRSQVANIVKGRSWRAAA